MVKATKLISFISSIFLAIAPSYVFSETTIKASVEASYIDTNNANGIFHSWQEQGTGVTRYDGSSNRFNIRQGFLELESEIFDSVQANLTAYGYRDGEKHLGITEAFLTYKPLSSGWLQRYRVGFFYPAFSTENVATAWQSPFTYSYSAINSWIGEELRVQGVEAEFIRLGRRAKTDYDLSLVGAIFIGNDPLGSLLSWRGWAIHDRQTLFSDRVEMANYPTIDNENFLQPSWVEPFKEIDGRPGYYLGLHYKVKRKHDVRLYWYDNLGNPIKTDADHQYSWRTNFASLAWKYNLSPSTLLMTQAMYGTTFMGHFDMVRVDFFSAYLMLSKKTAYGRFSARVERFLVNEQDDFPVDASDSDGNAVTLAWRIPVFENDEFGVEYLSVGSYNENRYFWDVPLYNRQKQWQVVYKFNF